MIFISKMHGGRVTDSHLTTGCGLLDLIETGDLILADKVSSLNNKYISFLGRGMLSKIRFFQSYVVLWIHVNDAICKSDFPIEIGWRKARENSCGSESF